MNINLVLEIVRIVLYVIIGFVAWYFKTNQKLQDKVTGVIDEAEYMYQDVAKAGGQKHEFAVDALYGYVPAPLKVIISRDMVSTIVDNAFDAIESYAKQQLDKVVDKKIK
ncbi:MAG: hypothetical protein [Bacteriophage sp.]|nr:MAG: hypothetical protein [Bacteriophage sp.]